MTLSRLATWLVIIGFLVIVGVVGMNTWRTYELARVTVQVGDTVDPERGPWKRLSDYMATNNAMLRALLADRGIETPTPLIPTPTP